MALRIPWDIEEAVLMLDMLLKSIDGKLTRKEAIRQVSEKLRRRAVNRGITIDDIFRNENGITFQMSALEVAYTGIKTKLKQPTKLFVETVNLYRNHRELYEEILKEAENVVEPKSVQDEFCSYLSMQMPTFQLSDAYLMLSDIESFCLERKILQNKLFETTDLEAIKRVVQTVDSNRVFRFTYKQNLKKMSTVIHAYYAFLKSYKPDEEKEVKPIIQDAIPSLPDADSMKQKDDAVGPQAISVPVAERTKLTDQEEKQKFNDWMLSSGMSKATITSYMSSFGQCVKSVANYKLCETSLWNVANAEDASHIYDQLFGISEFYEYNKQQHNRFSAAFRKFILGYSPGGGAGDPGVCSLTEAEIQAVLDDIPDGAAKNACDFALHRVGYPYSQELRHSGTHFDCSSLVYYAWLDAGVDISFGGATTAGYEAQGLANAGKTTVYEDMQPGDLIFFSYEETDGYLDISHVGIYVGNGKMVDARGTAYGVVYRDVPPNSGAIVMIGRPN